MVVEQWTGKIFRGTSTDTKPVDQPRVVAGSLFAETNTGKMFVFNGSTSAWQEVAGGTITNYLDFTVTTTPANPPAGTGRMYPKLIDANNEGMFVKLMKGGAIVELQYI
jgi:hypothetical protein